MVKTTLPWRERYIHSPAANGEYFLYTNPDFSRLYSLMIAWNVWVVVSILSRNIALNREFETMPERILICRFSAIGDTVHSLPLASALRRRFPNAFMAWAVEKPSAELVVGHPSIDRVYVMPRKWLKSPAEVLRLRREMRRDGRFTLAVDVQSLTKSAVAAWLSGARRRLGFSRPSGRELAPLFDTELVAPKGTHVVDQFMSLLAPLDIPASPVEFALPPCPEKDLEKVEAAGNGFALFAPWASWSAKCWPLERYGELARRLQMNCLMLAHGDEERHRVTVLAGMSGGCLQPAPDVGLLGVAELARRSRVFVGSDSAPMHLAAAAGARCVALHGPTPGERNGPYGEHQAIIQKARPQFANVREQRRSGQEAISAISVDEVCAACAAIMSNR